MKKYSLFRSVFLVSIFALSVAGAGYAEPTHIHKKPNILRELCGTVIDAVAREMGNDPELGERIVQVYGWVLEGSKKPRGYAKDRAAFEKECKAIWQHKVSPELYEQLHKLNALGKKSAGMAGWKKAALGVGVSAGLLAITAWSSWDKNKDRNLKRPKTEEARWKAMEESIRQAQGRGGAAAPSPGPAAAAGRIEGILGAVSVAPHGQPSPSGPSRGKRPAPVTSLEQVFVTIANNDDGNLIPGVEDGRKFRDLLGSRYNTEMLSPLLDIAIGRYDDDINRLFYKPSDGNAGYYSNVTSTFLSLAAEKGLKYWPVCKALIDRGAKTNLGKPLPVKCLKDTMTDWELSFQDVPRFFLTLMKDLSLDQLQKVFDSPSHEQLYNYFTYCISVEMLQYFRMKGCRLNEAGVVDLVDTFISQSSLSADIQTFMRALNDWCADAFRDSKTLDAVYKEHGGAKYNRILADIISKDRAALHP